MDNSSPDPRGNIAWAAFADEQFCYLTTTGRVTGRPHQIEIWFAIHESALYLLSGARGRSDWIKNLQKTPAVTVEIGIGVFAGRARIVFDEDEDELARRLVHDKYAPGYGGGLGGWRLSALPVAVDLERRLA